MREWFKRERYQTLSIFTIFLRWIWLVISTPLKTCAQWFHVNAISVEVHKKWRDDIKISDDKYMKKKLRTREYDIQVASLAIRALCQHPEIGASKRPPSRRALTAATSPWNSERSSSSCESYREQHWSMWQFMILSQLDPLFKKSMPSIRPKARALLIAPGFSSQETMSALWEWEVSCNMNIFSSNPAHPKVLVASWPRHDSVPEVHNVAKCCKHTLMVMPAVQSLLPMGEFSSSACRTASAEEGFIVNQPK